jgi:hypothetical protein
VTFIASEFWGPPTTPYVNNNLRADANLQGVIHGRHWRTKWLLAVALEDGPAGRGCCLNLMVSGHGTRALELCEEVAAFAEDTDELKPCEPLCGTNKLEKLLRLQLQSFGAGVRH